MAYIEWRTETGDAGNVLLYITGQRKRCQHFSLFTSSNKLRIQSFEKPYWDRRGKTLYIRGRFEEWDHDPAIIALEDWPAVEYALRELNATRSDDGDRSDEDLTLTRALDDEAWVEERLAKIERRLAEADNERARLDERLETLTEVVRSHADRLAILRDSITNLEDSVFPEPGKEDTTVNVVKTGERSCGLCAWAGGPCNQCGGSGRVIIAVEKTRHAKQSKMKRKIRRLEKRIERLERPLSDDFETSIGDSFIAIGKRLDALEAKAAPDAGRWGVLDRHGNRAKYCTQDHDTSEDAGYCARWGDAKLPDEGPYVMARVDTPANDVPDPEPSPRTRTVERWDVVDPACVFETRERAEGMLKRFPQYMREYSRVAKVTWEETDDGE